MRRITKAALGGLAGCALVIGGTQLASGDSIHNTYTWAGDLSDLRPDVSGGPLDGANASVRIKEAPGEGIAVKVQVKDINLSTAKSQFGAHLHTGPCTAREVLGTDPITGAPVLSTDTTGPHYTVPKEPVSALSEVWLDFWPALTGVATDETSALFVIKGTITSRDMSIVIHRDPTNSDPAKGTVGSAGPREACLPVDVPDWVVEPI